MSASGAAESIVDYSRFDFGGRWSGRENVSAVERTILAHALRGQDRRRILEVGTGFGRLLPVLQRSCDEVVALDLDGASLARLPGDDPHTRRVAANVYHLPFVDAAFTGATMVRLHHHLTDPVAVFRELARVIGPGGHLVVSYTPTPSVGTLVFDLARSLRPRDRRELLPGPLTFSRGPVLLGPSTSPIRSIDRSGFEAEASAAGWALALEVGCGFEEYSVIRRSVPVDWFVSAGERLGRAPGFPTRFARFQREGTAPEEIPPLDRILACPRCREIGFGGWDVRDPVCRACGFEGSLRGRVLDLRYVPAGTPRWEVAP